VALTELDAALDGLRRHWESPALRAAFHAHLGRPVELSTVRTLRSIERAGDGPCVGDIADLLMVDHSTASRMVDTAAAAGLASRTPSPRDRRRTVLALTPAGVDLLDAANAARAALLEELTQGWPPEDLELLTSLLRRLTGAVIRMEARP
jgi:DNA-binding MarR family transcriptional regulator